MFKNGYFFCQYCKNREDDLKLTLTDLTGIKKTLNIPLPAFLLEINLNCEKCGCTTRFRVPLDRSNFQ